MFQWFWKRCFNSIYPILVEKLNDKEFYKEFSAIVDDIVDRQFQRIQGSYGGSLHKTGDMTNAGLLGSLGEIGKILALFKQSSPNQAPTPQQALNQSSNRDNMPIGGV